MRGQALYGYWIAAKKAISITLAIGQPKVSTVACRAGTKRLRRSRSALALDIALFDASFER